jgi:steroid delta-isomerase-like uncharacterized protein
VVKSGFGLKVFRELQITTGESLMLPQMTTKLLFQAGLFALLLCGCVSHQHLVLQRNKEIIHRYFEEWGNHGDTKAADELIATNVTLRNPPAILHSLDEYKKGMAAFHTAFPDLHFTVEELIAEGDKVVVHWSLRATHLGDYQGRPATGKTVTVAGMSLFRMAEGKIQEITVSMDRLGQWQQLGWLPEPAKAK